MRTTILAAMMMVGCGQLSTDLEVTVAQFAPASMPESGQDLFLTHGTPVAVVTSATNSDLGFVLGVEIADAHQVPQIVAGQVIRWAGGSGRVVSVTQLGRAVTPSSQPSSKPCPKGPSDNSCID